jgi:ankyrin repeat protein
MRSKQPSSLHAASSAGDIRRVKALLASGEPILAKQGESTALHAAAARGKLEIVRILLETGGRKALETFDSDGRSPLICAVESGNIELVKLLLAAGARVNGRSNIAIGNTALRVAAAQGTPQMVQLLLEAGADPLIPGRMMLTPLDRALERRTPEGRIIAAMMSRTIHAPGRRTRRRKPDR